MKTKEQAEARALELYPIHPEFDVDRLKPLREAFLAGVEWEKERTELTNGKSYENLDAKGIEHSELPSEKQEEIKTREQAEARANELFPKVEGNDHLWTSRVVVEREIKAFLQCWDEMQKNKQTLSEGVSDETKGVNAESEGVNGKQTCFCFEPEEVEMIECPDCNGEGTWFNDTSRQCTTYRGDCCGGCGYDVTCENCSGTGEIEKE